MEVGSVTTTLRADLAPLQAGLKQGAADVHGFQSAVESGISRASTNGRRGLGRLENAVTNLGLSLVGFQGPLGTVTDKLGGFFIGGAVTAGVFIGLGAMALAVRTLQRDMVAFDKAILDHRKNLADLAKRWAETGQAEFDATTKGMMVQREAIKVRIAFLNVLALTNKTIIPDLIEANKALIAINTAITDSMKVKTKAIEDETKAWSKLSGEMIRAAQTAVEASAIPAFLLGQTKPPDDMAAPGYTTEPYNPGYTPRILLGARQREGLIEQVDKDASQWQAVGLRVGEVVGDGLARGLARTLLEGGKTIGDTLKNVFHAILEEILVEIVKPFAKKIGKLIGDALSGGGVADGLGLGLLGGAIGIVGGFFGLSRASLSASTSQSGGTLVVPLSGLPPSPSPVVMARDAQHQMLWMETARVAQQLGWRVRLA